MGNVLASGMNFVYSREFIKSQYGETTYRTLINSLPEDAKNIWDNNLVAHEHYPFFALKEMMNGLSIVLGKNGNMELAHIYEYIAGKSLNVMYRMFFKVVTPSFTIKNYPKLWGRFFNTGTVEVLRSEKGYAKLQFTVPDIFLDWLTPACTGFSKKAVEMAKGNNLSIKELSKKQSSDHSWEIIYELRWDEELNRSICRISH